ASEAFPYARERAVGLTDRCLANVRAAIPARRIIAANQPEIWSYHEHNFGNGRRGLRRKPRMQSFGAGRIPACHVRQFRTWASVGGEVGSSRAWRSQR